MSWKSCNKKEPKELSNFLVGVASRRRHHHHPLSRANNSRFPFLPSYSNCPLVFVTNCFISFAQSVVTLLALVWLFLGNCCQVNVYNAILAMIVLRLTWVIIFIRASWNDEMSTFEWQPTCILFLIHIYAMSNLFSTFCNSWTWFLDAPVTIIQSRSINRLHKSQVAANLKREASIGAAILISTLRIASSVAI